ncbi:MAG TPA: hypothetical protein VLW50_18705 [Streptosporangiaceae bacterium]|nr:hypothetical protein [Streptosporangiaceae bacterium]
MSLRARERRRLRDIQGALGHSDPQLASVFAIFSQLAREEEMPGLERLRVRADRFTAQRANMRMAVLSRLRIILITPVALAATAGALLVGGWSSGPGTCKAAPAMTHSSHGRAPSTRLRPTRLRPATARCQSTPWRPVMAGR